MSMKELPLSGYTIPTLYTTRQELKHQPAAEDTEEHGAFRFGWDWRWLNPETFEVRISVSIEPSTARPEYIETNVIGRFQQVEPSPRVPLEEFVKLQAVAILLPYARQFLSQLTLNSLHGAYFLQTLNVAALMEDFDPAKATGALGGTPQTEGQSESRTEGPDDTRKRLRSPAKKKR